MLAFSTYFNAPINTPICKLAKCLLHILKSLTSTKYTVRGTFAFVEEIVEQDSELFMGILDVDSFYTKIPNQETINICTNTLFENTERAEGLSKKEFNLSLPKN